MAYVSDRKPGELSVLTSLATDDVIIVGDTSDVSEVAKGITKANLIVDLKATLGLVPYLEANADISFASAAERAVRVTASAAGVVGTDLALIAGNSGAGNTDGGDILISGGLSSGTGIGGDILLQPGRNGRVVISDIDIARTATLNTAILTDNRTYTLPNNTGTLALLSDITGGGDVVGPAVAVTTRIATYNGTTGKIIQDGGATIAQVRDRSTHTGTQLASTVSDFDSSVSANSAVALNTAKVTNATHTGEVTGATALTIANSVVTLAKMADVATASVFYRKTAATGVPEVQTLATLKTDLGLTGTNTGDQTSVTGNAGTVTTNASLTGPITSTGNTTAVAAQTGTGSTFVMNTSPVLVTPTLGAATATSLNLANNISATSWTTAGLRIRGIAAILTDTTSTGTVAAAYTNALGGNTIAATNITTFTDYITAFFREPIAGTNVTFTRRAALGAESLRVGTSNHLTVSLTGVLTATSPVFTTPNIGTATGSITGNAGTATASTNLSGGLGGSIPYQSAVNTTVLLANGTAGQVLQSNGTTLAPSWVAAGAGDTILASAQTNSGLKTFLNATFGLRNVANTITSFFSSAATVARTYTLQDRNGTLADDTDLALKANLASPSFSGTVGLPSGQALIAPVLGTPASGTLTNATGLPIAGLVASITQALGVGSIELGHATDTTLSRSAAGVLAVEGVVVPTISSTNTFTNKELTRRVGTTTSSATPTINSDNVDVYSITAQAVDITSFTTNLTGTPTHGRPLIVEITGTAARAITWGLSFEASTVALPTTTATTAMLTVGFRWNSATSKFRVIAVA